MAHVDHSHEKPGSGAEALPPITAGELVRYLFIAAIGVIAARYVSGSLPLLLAAAVASLMPARVAGSAKTRAAFAAIAFFITLFVVRMWPGAETSDEPVKESATTLTWLIGLPIGGAVFTLFLPRQAHATLRAFTLFIMLATLALCIPLLQVQMGRGWHFNHDVPWLTSVGVRYHVALDGISLWLVILTAFIVPIATYASFGSITTRLKDWCFALLLLEGAMIGTFVSVDLFLFYVFWEMTLIPMYVMVGVWGGTNRVKSAIKFFLYTMFGSILMLAALLYMAYQYSKLAGHPSFDFFELQRVLMTHGEQRWIWGAFALAFLIKVPMFPLHTWLPDAHTEAPTAGSMILAAIMLKMGTYGYLRFCMGLFPEASAEFGAILAGVAVVGGILYGALVAWKQDDIKRLVAYSSVAHLGYVMLGIFSATPSGIEGSVLQMVNHGISTPLLFLLVGVIYDRRHTRHVDDFGGIAKVMPVYAALFIVATMASVGLPGTNGFVGEFMIITGTFNSTHSQQHSMLAIGATLGVILAALYMLSMVQKVFFGPIKHKENKHLSDMNPRELIAAAPLVAMVFVIGLFPRIFLDPMHGACERVRTEFENRIAQNPVGKDADTGYYRGPTKLIDRAAEAPPPPAPPPPPQGSERGDNDTAAKGAGK
ncbi:MAG: NADH-quinone oxidoreductase subunit M [Polyangiaceae bacterium]